MSIKLHAPLEYDMIMNVSGVEPEADFIESISYSSLNPYFRTMTFRKLLIGYRENGCWRRRYKEPPSPEAKKKALETRRKHMYGF